MPAAIPAPERVMAKVVRQGDCWIFTGAKLRHGYGNVRVWNGERWANSSAHRVMYEDKYGPVPDGLFLLYDCDTPPCCNPDHVKPGTQRRNLEDGAARGRIDWRQNAVDQNQTRDPKSGRFIPEGM